jgi:Stabilization of polarity axis
MLPEGAHNRTEDATYIFLNRNQCRLDEDLLIHPMLKLDASAGKAPATATPAAASKAFLYGYNLVRAKHDANVRRGAEVKAIAMFSRFRFVDRFRGLLRCALEQYFSSPKVEVLEQLFNTLNSIDLSQIHMPNLLEISMMRRGVPCRPLAMQGRQFALSSAAADKGSPQKQEHTPAMWTREVHVNVASGSGSGDKDPTSLLSAPAPVAEEKSVVIPLYRSLDDVGDVSVTTLVRTLGPAVMRVYNAILTKQRVLFVGYNHPARDVSGIVLAAVAMVSPMPNILHRTYPYANLTDLAFLEVDELAAIVSDHTRPSISHTHRSLSLNPNVADARIHRRCHEPDVPA